MPWYFYNNRGVLKQDGIPDEIPVGVVIPYTSSDVIPTGGPPHEISPNWLLCDGSTFSAVTFPQLATVLGTTTLPNLSGRFIFGAGSVSPVTTGGTSTHTHSTDSHTHINTHTHTAGTHRHVYDHEHSSSHYHGSGSYTYDPMNIDGAGPGDSDNCSDGGSDSVSKGYNSGNRHHHNISGDTGVSGQPSGGGSSVNSTDGILSPNNGLNTSYDGSGTSGGSAHALNSAASSLSPIASILPPHLNVYFIIKARDLSGTYI